MTVFSALGSALVATFASRIGAAYNMPIGLVIAFALLGMSAWCARSRGGITGFAVHMLCSTLLIYMIAQGWPNGDAVIVGFHDSTLPWLSLYCGVIWLYGSILLQAIMLFLPARWFPSPGRKRQCPTYSIWAPKAHSPIRRRSPRLKVLQATASMTHGCMRAPTCRRSCATWQPARGWA